MDAGPWNILEVAKLITGVLSPVAVAGIGVYIHRVTRRFEHVQWRSQKLVEKRLAVYDDLVPYLNDLLCYFTFVGCWRDLDPPQVIALKRVIDKKIYLASPLFSHELCSACMKFQDLCFQAFNGWGIDATLKTSPRRRMEARSDWTPEWNRCFSETVSDPNDIKVAYREIMQIFAIDIGVNATAIIPPTGRIPANYS
ncbi:hypothetical protein [Paraburkholderia sp. Cpub6]|uniref:hypothetical protein n=1 Tax=Paraburkholderia sp. Cpub6 TaxID=2723094 RepID=UPI00161B5BB8|nr:hypothetical protein [Paraburkholderia sp. Cpub6]MBB5463590.1 hypothetical protein [Paraburkholderia sp. Cpub6]